MRLSVITHNPLYQALQSHIEPNSLSNWSTQLMAHPVLSPFFTAWTVSVTYTAVNMVNVQHLSLSLAHTSCFWTIFTSMISHDLIQLHRLTWRFTDSWWMYVLLADRRETTKPQRQMEWSAVRQRGYITLSSPSVYLPHGHKSNKTWQSRSFLPVSLY